jgi:hypothetical protein
MNQRRKKTPSWISASRSRAADDTRYRRMICSANRAPSAATTTRTTRTSDSTRFATSRASSGPLVAIRSTNTGTKTEVRIPPRISS